MAYNRFTYLCNEMTDHKLCQQNKITTSNITNQHHEHGYHLRLQATDRTESLTAKNTHQFARPNGSIVLLHKNCNFAALCI